MQKSSEAAAANQSRAMEADTILKNGRSLKSLINKGFFLTVVCFVLLAVFNGCGKGDDSYKGHPLIGTWSRGTPTSVTYMAYTFKADGTGTFEMIWSEISLNKNVSFKWSINGTKVTITNASEEISYMAAEIFFDSKTDTFYNVQYSSQKYTKKK